MKIKDRIEQLAPSSAEITTPNSFDDIVLTPEEEAAAIRVAKEVKAIELRKQQWREEIQRRSMFKTYTADELFNALHSTRVSFGNAFTVDDTNSHQVKQLCY